MKSLTVAIPSLNEEKNIKKTYKNIIQIRKIYKQIDLQIILINDGSTDKTGSICSKLAKLDEQVLYINNSKNIGLGESLKKAIKAANKDKFIFIPGDNDISYEDLIRLIEKSDQSDIVMMYFLNDEIRGRFRTILSSIFKTIYSTTFGFYVQYVNGPAIYTTKEIKKLKLFSNRFSIVAEINTKLLKKGFSYCEIPAFRNNGLCNSASNGLKIIFETVKVYLLLVFEVYFFNKNKYKKNCRRINIL